MKIVNRKISELITAEYNPRKLTVPERDHLRSSLQRFGMVDPVIVNTHPDRKDIIVGGHQRVSVWRELGHKDIPCVEVKLPIERERELNIRLNKNAGEWDKNLLARFFKAEELVEYGFDLGEIKLPDLSEATEGAAEPSINGELEGEVQFSREIDERSDYIVLKFDRDVDFLQIQTLLGLKSVASRNSQGKFSKMGIGRVVDGVKAIELIRKGAV